ncbi:hypothetical protein RQP53_18845 [Paucibacter sp. APW11]|uniref:Outer membrane protein beta-barrel domain-containing protein n=1 Tax=Roseateles aquae TaxID=3077235 RepID=A0ABU3PFI2_9BURK|nr:hypothetical protein [Paucibacter sp. APW11]MDT9001345.1 hypothetical protein [Paucibacter sp. APW11]
MALASTPARPLIALLLAGLFGSGAHAESSPYYVGTSLGLTRVANVYRLDSAQPANNDWVTTGSLLAGIDQRYGRQRIYGNLSLNANRYRHNSLLNNTAYQLDSGLDWSAFDKLGGTLTAGGSKSLAEFNPGGDKPSLTIKNVLTTKRAGASARYGLAGQLSLEARANHYTSRYSASEYLPYNYEQNDAAVGLVYRSSPSLSLGSYGRLTRGSYPNYRLVGGSYVVDRVRRKDLDLTANWQPSALSSLSARLSFGRATHSEAGSGSFSGTTGSLVWQWQALPKLGFNTTLSRETGLDSTPVNGSPFGNEIDYNRVTNRVRLGADYAMSAKIGLTASYAVAKRDQRNSFGVNSVAGSDTLTSWRVGLNWSATRNALLSCQYTHDERSLGQAQPISPYTLPYSANSMGCTGQYMLR